ncbi:type IV pilin protein [Thiohalomonas denitrificans]|uniref:Type IV pilus assembly protein PilE n=1 Tax=Thiohalomonas denitrificans TaxID=415747 RepID=A0A1G5PRD9_9GAMM|nr:type IV pilin protein [Thiohalomonas denitrificans]SCZ51609.1 type IV pilus assembly protein PilE [Thiohalomonas denitrificans]
MKKQYGFTLIELMVVVAIIAILAAVAYPSYTAQVQKAKRSAVQQFMMEIALAQDQFILDTMIYADSVGDDGDATADDLNLTIPAEVDDNYAVTIPSVTTSPPSYLIRAVPKTGSQMAGTATLELDSDGTKTPADEW